MSQIANESVPSDSDASLIVGTPEYIAYYYDKLEESLYRYMSNCVQRFPDISMTKTWVSLGEAGQKSAVAKLKWVWEYGEADLNIEDQEQVDRVTMVFIGLHLAELSTGFREIMAELDQKNSKKAEPANLLLKKALRKSRIEKQNQ